VPPTVRLLPLTLALACAEGPTERVIWRGGPAAVPENSRLAIQAIEDGDRVHLDLFLSQERTPVFNALPYLDPERCQTLAANPIEEEVWLLQTDVPTLQAGWRCGSSEPDFPDARTSPDTVALLDELLEGLEDGSLAPAEVHLQLGWAPNVSHDPAVFAAEVLERWARTDTDAQLVLMADTAAMLDAARSRAEELALPMRTALLWPRHPPKGSQRGAELGHGLGLMVGVTDPVDEVLASGADEVIVRPTLADRGLVRSLEHEGLSVGIGPLRRQAQVRAFSKWPVDRLLVADPTDAR
jgi:glycerophosphoryl diester phosphodiesterase